MGSESGFFFNPLIIKELATWLRFTGEKISAFEPISSACVRVDKLFLPFLQSAGKLQTLLNEWCSSEEFEAMILSCHKSARNLWLDEASKNFTKVTGVKGGVDAVALETMLRAFSSLVRNSLRSKESRSTVRIDELILWQAEYMSFSAEQFGVWLLCNVLDDDTTIRFFGQLVYKGHANGAVRVNPEAAIQANTLRPLLIQGLGLAAAKRYREAEEIFSKAVALKQGKEESLRAAISIVRYLADNETPYLVAVGEAANSDLVKAAQVFVSSLETPYSETIEREIEANGGVLTRQALAFRLLHQKRSDRALEVLQALIKEDEHLLLPSTLVSLMLLADSFLADGRRNLNDPPVFAAPQNNSVDAFLSCRHWLAIALRIARELSLSGCVQLIQTKLGGVFILLRDFDLAQEVLSENLAANGECPTSLENLAIVSLAQGRLGDVHEAVSKLKGVDAVIGGRCVGDSFFHANAFDEAIRVWNDILEYETDKRWRMRLQLRKLETFRLLRRQPQAQECTDGLIAEFGKDPELLFSLGCELIQIGQFAQGEQLLNEAKELAASVNMPNLRGWIAWELGRLKCQQDRVLSATDEYALVADRNVNSIQSREFAIALFRAGLKPAAFERAVKLRDVNGGVIPGVTEIEVDVLIAMGRVQEARDLLVELDNTAKVSTKNKIAIVRLSIELSEYDTARKYLRELSSLSHVGELGAEIDELQTVLQ